MLVQAVFAVAFGLVSGADEGDVANSPEARCEALLGRMGAASKGLDEALRNAEGETQRRAAFETFKEQRRDIVGRLLDLALAHPGDPAAVDALAHVVGHQITPLTGRALELLLSDYIDSDRLVAPLSYASNVVGPESLQAERLLREAAARNPHRRVRGMARMYLVDLLEARAEMLREVGRHPGEPPPFVKNFGAAWARLSARSADELTQEAEAQLVEIVKQYPDVETSRKAPLGEVAEGRLFRLRNLVVGKVAPEIVGEDIDGKRFCLSDYRGKVVLLTFSGNWCGSCRALYPEERRLVEQLKGKPFVVLSVNTDQDKETLRKSIDSGEIAWRCWRDGGTGGPITLRWGISYFPSLYLIDQHGVIRHTDADLSADKLAGGVEALVEQAVSSPSH